VKVAYYSPLPPERTGVADYSALLLPELERRLDVSVVRRGSTRVPQCDVSLYHIGNNTSAHEWILQALERKPGVVVLHDFVLHHLVADLTLGRGDSDAYVAAMEREAGVLGRLLALGVVDGALPPLSETRAHHFPLARVVLDRAHGLIVHSRSAETRALKAGFEGPVWRIPHPAWPVPAASRQAGLPEGSKPLIGSFGNLTRAKRIPELLEAFVPLRTTFPGARLLLVGEVVPPLDLSVAMERLALRPDEDVLVIDHVTEERLWDLIAACDICVNLRWPSMGETSGMAIRILVAGRPLLVSDNGWFSELPEPAVAKIPVDEWEVETLAAMLELLAGDEAIRRRMSVAARDYVREEHDLGRVADAYAGALASVAHGT
jgi:glycosyltransferase involved in cell wall biosynthesis